MTHPVRGNWKCHPLPKPLKRKCFPNWLSLSSRDRMNNLFSWEFREIRDVNITREGRDFSYKKACFFFLLGLEWGVAGWISHHGRRPCCGPFRTLSVGLVYVCVCVRVHLCRCVKERARRDIQDHVQEKPRAKSYIALPLPPPLQTLVFKN